jgi:hypothetical protein
LSRSIAAIFSKHLTLFSELGDGHYWQNTDLIVNKPIKIIGDENNPSNVIVEMSGTIVWQGRAGYVEGLTLRRPQISSDKVLDRDLILIEKNGNLTLKNNVLDNEGSYGNVVRLHGPGRKGVWEYVSMQNGVAGILLEHGANIDLSQVS